MSEKKQEKQHDSSLRLVIPFFVVLGLLTVVSFCIPLRPTQSQMEKRNLAQFPAFSWEALSDGTYFDDITTWFSDTFPGREEWLTLSSTISSLHGHSEISISGDLPSTEVAATVPAESVDNPEPEPEIPTERAPAEEATEPEEETTEPEETGWGGIQVDDNAEIEIGESAVIQIGESAFNAVRFTQATTENYVKNVNNLAEQLAGTDVTIISAPCPTSIGILLEPEMLDKLNCAHQDDIINFMHELMSDDIVKVDTFSALITHNSEYIYFRTDHHWTALGAYYSYSAICEAMGYEAAPLDSFTEWNQGDFEGSLYWKATNPKKLNVDTLIAYVPQGDIVMKIYRDNNYGWERDLIQDFSDQELNTKYCAFLGGDYPITVITNNSLPDGPSCILVKDSFGNSLAPFLTQNYYKIYAIDYREFYTLGLREFVKNYPVDDIIFAPYVIALQGFSGMKLFDSLCR